MQSVTEQQVEMWVEKIAAYFYEHRDQVLVEEARAQFESDTYEHFVNNNDNIVRGFKNEVDELSSIMSPEFSMARKVVFDILEGLGLLNETLEQLLT